MDEPIVIRGGEIKSAIFRILELRQQHVEQLPGEIEVALRQRLCNNSSSASARKA